jgi:polysaccharide pyruvyl transferase WcaK-like protein
MRSPHFLLVGNGPYSNRGCEAIVRGTMAILRHEFGEAFRVTLATVEAPDIVAGQAAHETDPLITHVPLRGKRIGRWSLPWWSRQITRSFLPQPKPHNYEVLDPFCKDATCALQIGGDNYTLDYGLALPRECMRLDEHLSMRGVPLVLWGASVGPFEAAPAFGPEMFAHLRAMRGILVRESDSYEYLKQHDVEANLHRMSDPAFVMEPVEPRADKLGCPLPTGAIGLNLSPMMANYVTKGDMRAWVTLGADIVQSIIRTARRDVLLIPHVTWAQSNDHEFLRRVANACPKKSAARVFCLGDKLSAAETKWVISRCAAFVGARTHSTIAAISSAVPTLSLAYSRKARGLNQDIFGSQEFCLQPTETTPTTVAERVSHLLERSDAIVKRLAGQLPENKKRALQGGAILRRLAESR